MNPTKSLCVEFQDYLNKPIGMVMCGNCDKKITYNLIASWGTDHHDPSEIRCEDCFNGLIARAESANDDTYGS